MAHDHSHDDRNAFYLNQLFTIAVCAALGGVCVMLWYGGNLRFMLATKFHIWVLLGGIALLALVLIRAFAVWRSVEEPATMPEHTHDHDHHHHDHDHGIQTGAQTTGISAAAAPPAMVAPAHHHHDHDHGHHHDHGHTHDDHGHDHGWAPWRYVVLLLPVVLYFLNLPNQVFSGDADISKLLGLEPTMSVQSRGQTEVGFAQLQQAALTPETRDYYEGKTVTLVGRYAGDDSKRFTLVRYKIACCAADAVKLNAVIMVDPNSTERLDPDHYRNQWVEVTGRIHFFNRPGSNDYITALILYPTKEDALDKLVKKIPPPVNPWVN